MNKFWNIIKKGISFAAIEPEMGKKEQKRSRVTNKILLKELSDHFCEQMEELSVGRRLLYPMSFNILMHPDDYNLTKESLPFVLPEVVSEFYAKIKRKRDEYHDGVNYAPPATYWFFQFSACQVGAQNGVEEFIKRGEIVTTGSLTTFDIHQAQQSNVHSEANVHLSVKCQNSNTNANNINMDALLGMEFLGEGSYSFKFDKTLNEDTSQISALSRNLQRGWAQLRWPEGSETKVYEMLDTYIDISGNADTRKTRNICLIKSDAVNISHVQIKYDTTTQTFALAAFGKTRLNSREVPLSNGGNPQWISLPKFNSKIFINDAISVEFNANSDVI